MTKWVDLILAKWGYYRLRRRLPAESRPLDFNDRDLIRSSILKTLLSATSSINSEFEAEFFDDVSHRILAELERVNSMSLHDQIREFHSDILAERMITYVLTCGRSCLWEIETKNLAEHLDINVYSERTSKGQKSPGFKKMEDIIKDIKKKLPKLELNLTKTLGLRGALVHGNFHQLRTYASESQRKEVRLSFKSKVWQMDFKNPKADPIDLNEVEGFDQIKKLGAYSWFMSAATSQLFETVALEFKRKIREIALLRQLKNLSFGDATWAFNHICVDGKRLTPTEEAKFIADMQTNGCSEAGAKSILDVTYGLQKK